MTDNLLPNRVLSGSGTTLIYALRFPAVVAAGKGKAVRIIQFILRLYSADSKIIVKFIEIVKLISVLCRAFIHCVARK